MKLTHRLFALALAALAPAVAVQIYNEFMTRQSREAEVHELAMRSAIQAASELERVLEGARSLLTAISKIDAVQALDTPACMAYFAKLQPEIPYLSSLAVADRDGQLRCSQKSPPDTPSYADQSYFQQAISTGELSIGEYTEGRILKGGVLPLAAPLQDSQGRTVGAVAAAIDLRWLVERLRERGLPPGGSVTVADRNGTIIAREPLPERFTGTHIRDAFRNLVNAPAPGSLEVTSRDGTRRVLGYVPASITPAHLYVSVGLSSKISYQAIDRANRRGLVVIAGDALLALLGASLVGRAFIEKPVKLLLEAAGAWRANDLSVRTGLTKRQGDLGRLGEEFDRVVEELASRQLALRESEARFRDLADSAPVLVWMLGPDKRGVYFNKPWLTFTGRSIERELGEGWFTAVHPDDRGALAPLAEAFEARSPFQIEFRMRRHDGEWRWVLDTGVPRFDASSAFQGFIGSCIDITERKRGEERQKLLLNELNHRVKNTLATVQSLAAQTLRNSADPESFRAAFEARLLALSKTHDLLTQESWQGASLSHLIEYEVAPYASSDAARRLTLSGDHLQLSPKHALALGMAIHELATNAVKYGALSTDAGRIDVSWHVTYATGGTGSKLVLLWSEHHGPPVQVPSHRGFGSRLIERSIRSELEGELCAAFDPHGLRVRFEVPLTSHAAQPVEAIML